MSDEHGDTPLKDYGSTGAAREHLARLLEAADTNFSVDKMVCEKGIVNATLTIQNLPLEAVIQFCFSDLETPRERLEAFVAIWPTLNDDDRTELLAFGAASMFAKTGQHSIEETLKKRGS